MPAFRGHEEITIDQFNGLYVRGRLDAVPKDHFSDGVNFQFSQNGVETRDGFVKTQTNRFIRRMYVFRSSNTQSHFIYLDNAGNLIDESTNSVILTIPQMTDFAFANYAGRAYISPHNGTTGLVGQSLYVYQGPPTSSVAVLAGGVAPSGAPITIANGGAGNTDKGLHLFSVSFETNTGFITPFSAVSGAVVNSFTMDGAHVINISGIPTGPANTVARRIVVTKNIPSYNFNPAGYQYFFLPGGRIADNVTTILNNVSFFDASLLTDATYALNLLGTIPAGTGLATYQGRLVSWGEPDSSQESGQSSTIRVSSAGQPEAFDSVTGLIVVNPNDSRSGVKNCQEYRSVLYMFKDTHTYYTQDNQGNPSSWNVFNLDQSTGTSIHGIAAPFDEGGIGTDKLFIVDYSGLLIFNGTYNRPEVSWKIRDLWAQIPTQYFFTIEIVHDPILQRIYIAVPLGSDTSPSTILLCDYANLDPFAWNFYQKVRWSKWTFSNGLVPTTIKIQTTVSSPNNFRFGSGFTLGQYYTLTKGQLIDDVNTIPAPFFNTSFLGESDGAYSHYNGIRLRINGSGSLLLQWFNEDATQNEVDATLTLNVATGFEPLTLSNFKAQKAFLHVALSGVNSFFKLNKIRVYAKKLWTMAPQ